MKNSGFTRHAFRLAVLMLSIVVSSFSWAADEEKTVASTAQTFHDALRRGDGAAAMKLLASDATILEGGAIETRAEYESHHLAADIAFAQAIASTRSNIRVQVNGDTARLTSASQTEGTFQERPINSRGAELMVFSKTTEGWQLRAIHWSSHKVTKAE